MMMDETTGGDVLNNGGGPAQEPTSTATEPFTPTGPDVPAPTPPVVNLNGDGDHQAGPLPDATFVAPSAETAPPNGKPDRTPAQQRRDDAAARGRDAWDARHGNDSLSAITRTELAALRHDARVAIVDIAKPVGKFVSYTLGYGVGVPVAVAVGVPAAAVLGAGALGEEILARGYYKAANAVNIVKRAFGSGEAVQDAYALIRDPAKMTPDNLPQVMDAIAPQKMRPLLDAIDHNRAMQPNWGYARALTRDLIARAKGRPSTFRAHLDRKAEIKAMKSGTAQPQVAPVAA